MDRTFDSKLTIGIGLLVAALIVDAVLTYQNIEQFRANAQAVAKANHILDALEDVVSTVKDAETGQRGYLITNNNAYLQPYDAAASSINGKVEKLRSLIEGVPEQEALFPELESKIKLKTKELKYTIDLHNHDQEAAKQEVLKHAGMSFMDDIRKRSAEMQHVALNTLRLREDQAARSYWLATISNLVTTAIGLALVAGFVYLLRRNLADRVRSAAELHNQREWCFTTLASIGDAVITTDASGKVTFLNAIAEKLTGWKSAEAVGQMLETVFQIVNEQTRKPVEGPVAKVLKEGAVVGLANHTILIRRDNTEIPIDDSAAPIRNSNCNITGVVMVFRDITERRRIEMDRERQTALIEQRGKDLAEADQRKNEFLAMLAHELRNPLAPIRNALQLIQLQGQNRDDGARQPLEIIDRQVEALIRLVDDLLDVSRITGGKINLQKKPVEVAEIISRAVESCAPLVENRRHNLSVCVDPASMPVNADLVRMTQVVSNLLTNAAKYTREGGALHLSAEPEENEAVIRMRDNGMGIPPHLLPKIFDLFTQAERTLDRAEGGLGIGLTLVSRLTEMHGGVVSANSRGSGQGSEFVVRLPLMPADALAGASERRSPDRGDLGGPESATPATPKRILVVDDNRDSAESLAMLLRMVGHQVRTVHDGRRVAEAVDAERPDVILLDIGLPGLDGYAVAQQLRAKPELAGTKLVALTGYGAADDRRRSHAAGFDAHLVKPVSFEDLNSLLIK